jgi:hypothetical protein
LRDEGKLTAARSSFVACARDVCPKVVRQGCSRWLEELDKKLPELLVLARDAEGNDVAGVEIVIDGVVLVDRLRGRAVPLDAGEHRLELSAPGHVKQAATVVLNEGEKGRSLRIVLQKVPAPKAKVASLPPVPPPAEPGFSPPALSLVLGGVAVLGTVGFAVLWSSAVSNAEEVRDSCAPRCLQSDADAIERRFIVADVVLGVGLAAAVAAVAVYVLSQPPSRASAASR